MLREVPTVGVINRWIEVDARNPLPSINDVSRMVGIEPPVSEPGDHFEGGQVDIAMYWPHVRREWDR